jgi:hypothetical protein
VNEATDPLLRLLDRLNHEGVQYILVGGQAVRLNGFLRNTEDIDILLPSSVENGERVIRALDFLSSASELDAAWFESTKDAPENIRVADDLLIDLLFAANGETFESLQPYVRTLVVDGVEIRTLDIEGLLKTKTNYREKDLLDRQALTKILSQLKQEPKPR